MKFAFTLSFLALFTIVNAQDVIVKKDDSTILAKVLEVNEDNIKYKKYSNQGGPTYTISLTTIRAINYENGDKDSFDASNSPLISTSSKTAASGYIERPADARNADIIARYNRDFNLSQKTLKKLKLNKEAEYFADFTGVTSTSIMSNEEAEMTFERRFLRDPYFDELKDVWYVFVKNKTNGNLYVDLGNSFIIDDTGDFYCYYSPEEIKTVTTGGSSGVGLGLGSVAGVLGIGGTAGQLASGISVGKSSSNSVSTTYTEQRVIAIPPQGKRNITEEKWIELKKPNFIGGRGKYEKIGHSESLIMGYHKEGMKQGEKVVCDEKDASVFREYIITYSTSENFSTFSTLKAKIYGRLSFGVKFWGIDPEFVAEDGGNMEWTIYDEW